MSAGIRWRLTVMMFLEFAIWGAWAPVLGAYLGGELHFTGDQIGLIFGMLPLASIVAPMIFGQLADRYVATQWLLAGLHLVGAVLLWMMADAHQYGPFLWIMLAYSVAFAPTLVLTNSLCFSHLRDVDREFGGIRVGGSLGWIVAGFSLTAWLWFAHTTSQSNCLRLAAIFSLLLGLFSLALPNTSPRREGTDPWAFLKAFGLLKERSFLVFMVISFIVATELQFYYILTAPFLQDSMHVHPQNTSSVMAIAQIAEVVVMAVLLPWLLPRWGIRKIMVAGILAWPIRYAVFALGAHFGSGWLPVVEASLALHGFCYVFFFIVGFIYVDRVAPRDIRHSAQSLIGVITLGIGLYLGSRLAGWLHDFFTQPKGHVVNWTALFLVPCAVTILCAIVFPLIFKERAEADLSQSATIIHRNSDME
ncbi:MAG: MFS transporter [Armatimonadota bacterium]|nr:MFS transporter [Armatimonadota bacterium]